jgi:hypothetical protein
VQVAGARTEESLKPLRGAFSPPFSFPIPQNPRSPCISSPQRPLHPFSAGTGPFRPRTSLGPGLCAGVGVFSRAWNPPLASRAPRLRFPRLERRSGSGPSVHPERAAATGAFHRRLVRRPLQDVAAPAGGGIGGNGAGRGHASHSSEYGPDSRSNACRQSHPSTSIPIGFAQCRQTGTTPSSTVSRVG